MDTVKGEPVFGLNNTGAFSPSLHRPPFPTTVFDRGFHTAYLRTLRMIQECKLGESISIIEPTVTMQEDSVDQEWFLSVENLWEVEVLSYPQKSKVHASSFWGNPNSGEIH